MDKRIKRDDQIDLMVNAPARMESKMQKWLSVPIIKDAVTKPDQLGCDDGFTQKRVKVACGR